MLCTQKTINYSVGSIRGSDASLTTMKATSCFSILCVGHAQEVLLTWKNSLSKRSLKCMHVLNYIWETYRYLNKVSVIRG